MTNQENVSAPENAWQHGYRRGVEDQKRKTEKVKKCLHKEQQRIKQLETALDDAGLPLPDRDKKIRQNFWSGIKFHLKRHWLSVLLVFLATLGLALLAIAFWPHFHNENLNWRPHWHNPFDVLVNYR